MNFLLIGGNGFIGSHLIDILLINKHKVRVYDLFQEKYRLPIDEVDYRIHSINDVNSLYEAMMDIDVIYHLASSSVPSTSNLDPLNDVNGNLITSLNFLNVAVRARIKKIVYFSSGGAIYGPTKGPIKENSTLSPISSYGIIKSTIERYFLLYSSTYDIDTIILRPSNPFGPRQGHYAAHGVVSTFLRKIANNSAITVFGNGESAKDYIYVKDLAYFCYNISISVNKGIYNVGTGVGTSVNELINLISKITNSNPEIIYEDVQNYDIPNFVLDISASKDIISDFEFTSLEKGIQETWNWLLTQTSKQ
jgi:UDP-glucose 4-epimerase